MPGDTPQPPMPERSRVASRFPVGSRPVIRDAFFWTLLGASVLVSLFFVFLAVQYVARGNPIERVRILGDREEVPGASDPDFSRLIQTQLGTAVEEGNRVEILFDGDRFYPRFFEDLRRAEDLITWHVYWFKPGSLADELHGILSERARAGVQVLLLYDYHGAWGIEGEYWDTLRAAGCEVHPFRPLSWKHLYRWQKRSHVRAVVIDGRVGYTGGFAIHDDWLGDGRHPGQWRDTNVRMEGLIVRRLQASFGAHWAEATGDLLFGPRLFPGGRTPAGPHRAGLLFNAPSVGSTEVERYYALSIHGARDSLYITNAYFVPDDDFRGILCEAAERGVDVRVLTPGTNTDRPSAYYAGRCHYQQLLDAGVRIWEYEPTMVHAKTLVADGVWCSVGTMNFDNRSMSLNEEVALLVQDEEIGRRLNARFLEDLERATELDPETFRGRGFLEKVRENFWVLFSRFL